MPLEVVEGKISEITTTAYYINREKVEKGILRRTLVETWSPVRVGQVVNKKKLDDFVNLLNHFKVVLFLRLADLSDRVLL